MQSIGPTDRCLFCHGARIQIVNSSWSVGNNPKHVNELCKKPLLTKTSRDREMQSLEDSVRSSATLLTVVTIHITVKTGIFSTGTGIRSNKVFDEEVLFQRMALANAAIINGAARAKKPTKPRP